eukprot:TRINITY_DN7030_c0_g1_i2.p1 TRINITY_DN7030_c0_g1~~TRINITY_DN7030_c0_g1_i2.p1  ORF type:complete len:123 (-),score=16.89 TRINITY_DN7030_c0_g1_i2:12-380(-)
MMEAQDELFPLDLPEPFEDAQLAVSTASSSSPSSSSSLAKQSTPSGKTSHFTPEKCTSKNCRAIPKEVVCFVKASKPCQDAGGKTNACRWYHQSTYEHYCNNCFEYYYRDRNEGHPGSIHYR